MAGSAIPRILKHEPIASGSWKVMSKKRFPLAHLALGALVALPAAGHASVIGPFASACAAGNAAMLVHVTGFKARTGVLRVQSYGGDPGHYFDKGTYLKRIEVQVPANGAADVCVPVPGPGRYAISVRHDVNGSGKTDRSDGGGMSGNPHLSLIDLMFKRKPSPDQVAVEVARGVRVVPVVLNYLQGGSFAPVTAG
jgi:uncharacterized protein (DUF2141 family)